MNAAEHLESHLGPIGEGWGSNSLPGVQVCAFREQPAEGLVTVATLGLSDFILSLGNTKRVRQELLFAFPAEKQPDEFAQLLLHVADGIVTRQTALLRGEVVPLGDRVAADSDAEALYASLPVSFPDSLRTLSSTEPPTVFVWLFPVLPREVSAIAENGWDAFEDALERVQPDLFDLARVSVI